LKKLSAILLAGALALGACGDDDEEPVVADETTQSGDDPGDAGDAPQRVVSLSPSATETLFAIGAEDQVVAVDAQSDFPEGVPATDLSAYEPNVEAIASYEPDLVVMTDDAELQESLEALDIEVLVSPAPTTIAGAYEEIEAIGEATGHVDEATELVEELRTEIDAIAEENEGVELLTAYWELDPTFYSVTSNTFIGEVMQLAGITSIADAADDGSGYPQLSPELIIEADPDLVILADTECCQQDAAAVAARPGFAELRAVTAGNVVELDDDIASRWGPRLIELVRLLDAAADEAAAG
jgi:iron complex transport system substrate-binding protein